MAKSNNKVFTLGHSPDPDDAFMFYALAEHKIDTKGHKFQHILEDIDTLNDRATRSELDITAISIHAYAYVTDKYALTSCGASMGDGYGPVLVAKSRGSLKENANNDEVRDWLKTQRIAVPGMRTSAYLALRLFLGICDSIVVPFDQIFDSVERGEADVGLIIHEGQLTYARDGFSKILDLGEWWKSKTQLPLPLGGNAIRKNMEPKLRQEITEILYESIQYGMQHRSEAVAHSMPLARNMDSKMAGEFISMYVNNFTLDYGEVGKRAIYEFLGEASDAGIIPAPVELEFISARSFDYVSG